MKPALLARARRWIAVLACAGLAAAALAQEREGPQRPAFNLDIRTEDKAVRELLQRHLELQRYREVPDLDEAELARLLRLADRTARELRQSSTSAANRRPKARCRWSWSRCSPDRPPPWPRWT